MSAATAKTQDPSMEEILASIRRIIADDSEAAKPDEASASRPRPRADDEEELDLADVPDAKLAPADLDIEIPDLAFQHAGEAPAAPVILPVSEPSAASRPEAPPLPPSNAGAGAPRAASLPTLDALISSETTASVSQAFNILSHTILTQNARTLEDLVRDMLKPMLKVWLDDNLPPLVERLVRAEIERVARGNR